MFKALPCPFGCSTDNYLIYDIWINHAKFSTAQHSAMNDTFCKNTVWFVWSSSHRTCRRGDEEVIPLCIIHIVLTLKERMAPLWNPCFVQPPENVNTEIFKIWRLSQSRSSIFKVREGGGLMNSKVAYFAAAWSRYWIKPQLWFILYWVYAADLNRKATFHSTHSCNLLVGSFKGQICQIVRTKKILTRPTVSIHMYISNIQF